MGREVRLLTVDCLTDWGIASHVWTPMHTRIAQANTTLLTTAEREAAALRQTLEGLDAALTGDVRGRQEDEAAEVAAVAARGMSLGVCVCVS